MKSTTPLCEITAAARAALTGRWGRSIGVVLVYGLLSMAVSMVPFAGRILQMVLSAPLMVGLVIYFLAVVRGQPNPFEMLFEGFNRFGTAVCTYLLIGLIVFAWMIPVMILMVFSIFRMDSDGPLFLVLAVLILIAVMIPLQMRYGLALYVVADDPSVKARQAIRRGVELMHGNYWRLGLFWLRFVGWQLLAVLTLGIGFIWLGPYYLTAMTAFYDDLVKNG